MLEKSKYCREYENPGSATQIYHDNQYTLKSEPMHKENVREGRVNSASEVQSLQI